MSVKTSRVMSRFGFVLFALALTLAPFSASAQTVTGTIQGTVADSGGGAMPGVTVVIRSLDTGLERVLVTNGSGFFSAPFLAIGRYRVTSSLSGFGSVVRDPVEVTLNSTTVTDFGLDPAMSETVVVSAAAPKINTVNAEIKGSLTAEQIIDKPTLNPSSFLSLAETFAGFNDNPTAGANNPTTSSGSSVNFNGTGSRGTSFQINGVNNDDSSENQNRQSVALSTIKEFVVLTNNFSAEHCCAYGAVVLVQTKQGTNDLIGDVYGYHQDSTWNQKSFFSRSSPKPNNKRDQYGFTAGFPLIRDRLFGFMSFEQVEFGGSLNYVRDLFLASELAGPRLTRGNDTPANRAFIESFIKRFPAGAVPNDPRSNRTYATLLNINRPAEDYSARLDWNISQSNQLTSRYQRSAQILDADDIIIGEQVLQDNKQQNFGAQWTYLFNDRTVGEARFGLGIRDTNADVKAGNDTPIIRFVGGVAGSIVGNAGSFPIHRDQNDKQFLYNLTSLLGNHSLKAGVEVKRQELDDLADSNSRGTYFFRAACGGTNYANAYLAFLDGCVSSFTKSFGPFFLENRINESSFYASDQWRVRPSLTLDLGARYERVDAPKEAKGRIDYTFDDNSHIDPRVAFAYVPDWKGSFWNRVTGGPGNSSIRGGYGVYHGRLFQSVFSQNGVSVRQNPPNSLNIGTTNQTNISDPTNGFVFTPGVPTIRYTPVQIDPELSIPYTNQWSLSYERGVMWNSSIRISYTGNQRKDQLRFFLGNLPVTPAQGGIVVANHPLNAPAAGFPDLRGVKIDKVATDVRCAGTGFFGLRPTADCPNTVPIGNNEISLRVPRTQERRPDPRYFSTLNVSNRGDGDYNGVQLEWIKRPSRGLQFQTSYTYSKAFDNVSEATFVGAGDTNQTGPDDRFARGPARYDTRHRFSLYGSYALPFFNDAKGLLGVALGGWNVSGVVRVSSGNPFTIFDSGVGDLNFDGFSEGRPVLLNPGIDGSVVNNPRFSTGILNSSNFRRSTIDDSIYDLVGRNTFVGDGVRNFDMALYKTFSILGQKLIARGELYNVFNRTQFGFPITDLASPIFGRIGATATNYLPRTAQVSLRYMF